MRNSQKYAFLRPSPLLAGLDPAVADDFLDRCEEIICQDPRPLLTQESRAKHVYLIAHGIVEVSFLSRQGHKVIANHAGPGDVLGDVEVVGDQPVIATCEAQAGAILMRSPAVLFRSFAADPNVQRNLMRLQAERLLRGLLFKDIDQYQAVPQRIGHYLQHLSRFSSRVTYSQGYLATLVGCSRQTINREIGQMKEAGLLHSEGNGGLRVDRAKLAAHLRALELGEDVS
ncbi:Crp/Fnr family transcriptional regulator [Pseudoruegeria sp. SHC-113]|uniref:Crp/Fnr family transcriptional regulator n=1 Tax=Pseudoruegeria sp. SHC-113 TaxID=2855439 RepID=UPI0021BB828E|nr:Crp/Fnr family transcriptional regulator [Pseudoruegeria sp. SHC-113]MCT8160550.1 Crp/Fnr family transcriptional regulator [Pseudoruegeria sp. SHC-113]